MDESELLEDFLSHWPESYNPYDEQRFVRWAIVSHRNGSDFPLSRFSESGMSVRAVDYYRDAYRFVGYTLAVLAE